MHDSRAFPAALQARLGYFFCNEALLWQALTHASYTNEYPQQQSYERLEFLGDAVVELLVTRYLFQQHPDWSEGRMTRTRAMVVSEAGLSQIARTLGLAEGIRLGRGTRQLGAQDSPAVLCDVFEALTGAIYLDGGMQCVQAHILPLLLPRIQRAECEGLQSGDFKTALQELLQRHGEAHIEYRLLQSEGPAHDMHFTVAVYCDSRELARGSGKSKKAAQQQAAGEALRRLKEKDE